MSDGDATERKTRCSPLKINLLSPSGPASLGILYEEAVGKFITEEHFVEAAAFSRFLPGSDALQLTVFVGATPRPACRARWWRVWPPSFRPRRSCSASPSFCNGYAARHG
ncbi:MAG: chromate transporter [Chloroflexota bacterium]